MKKWLLALVPIISIGALAWLPFAVYKDVKKLWVYAPATVLYAVALATVPPGGTLAALAGLYTVAFILSAAIFALLDGIEEGKNRAAEANLRGRYGYPFVGTEDLEK